MHNGIEDIIMWPPPPPHVPTHCFYSTGVSTPEIFKYSEDFPEINKPEVEHGEERDGQVSKEGSEACLRWADIWPVTIHFKLTIIVAFITWICFKMMVCSKQLVIL